jgi:PAS domain S-box-containing protein
MSEVRDFFRHLLDTSGFPPRWHCGYWTGFHGWLYIISDLAIWSAYFAIPVIIVRYISRKYDARYIKLYLLFAAFILACGSTHLLDAIMFWYPFYRVSALMRLFTAIVSWITVFSLVRILPIAFSQKTATQLEAEIDFRKRMEEQLKINNALLSEAQEIARLGHWQWDVVANKVEWSGMALKLFGLDAIDKEMDYNGYLQLLHPDDRQVVHDAIMQSFSSKTFPKFYHRILMPDGQIRFVLSRGEVIVNEKGEVVKMIGTVQDITDQKNTEQELLLKSQRLEASNIELQKFASIASHDLREPLRKILTFGSMLEKEHRGLLSERGEMYLQKITGASLRMQKLIDDILDFSRLTVNNQQFSRLRLNDVVTQVLGDMEVAISKSGAEITVDMLPEIDGNASQLGQLFQNLIANGIKFRRPGQVPRIKIEGGILWPAELPDAFLKNSNYRFSVVGNPEYATSERFCRLTIADNGVGFDETYLDRIFLIFQRLHDKSEYEGTGIGLAVCKKVADMHNGYITATSKQGEGATFIIILPVVQHQSA